MKFFIRLLALGTFSAFLTTISVRAEIKWNCHTYRETKKDKIDLNLFTDDDGNLQSYTKDGETFSHETFHPHSYAKIMKEEEKTPFRFAIFDPQTHFVQFRFIGYPYGNEESKVNFFGVIEEGSTASFTYKSVVCSKIE
ncbi:MAG: hypothetical protein QE271_01055 [Bacteriovoracaceae bacterium]|nr:hypothetical protein [Bacteriovoracaceae bacterium]